ncbi:hypothetical protein [Spongiimicrobium sp. 3-5]|uniref:hypothetical protein n=1 Tax=Spongiimicrobium sp. 3-5 TaxID=3332596 RepID=UPI003980FC2E
MKIQAKVIPGFGVASGKNGDQRYPKGTISQQLPHFEARGLDLTSYFKGTLNVDITPYSYKIGNPKHFFEQVNWSDHIAPENFYFFDITLFYKNEAYEGLIYMPDPKTKEEHVQMPTTLELMLPKVNGLQYGDKIFVLVNEKQLKVSKI